MMDILNSSEQEILETFEEAPFNNLFALFKPYNGKVDVFSKEPIYITTPIYDGKSSLDETIAIYWVYRGYLFRYSKYWGNVPQENNIFPYPHSFLSDNSDIIIKHIDFNQPSLMFVKINNVHFVSKHNVIDYSEESLNSFSRNKILVSGGEDIKNVTQNYADLNVERTDLLSTPLTFKQKIKYKVGVKKGGTIANMYIYKNDILYSYEFTNFRNFVSFNFLKILKNVEFVSEWIVKPHFFSHSQIKVRKMNTPYLIENNCVVFFKDIHNSEIYKYLFVDIKHYFNGIPTDKKIFVIENPTLEHFKALSIELKNSTLSKKEITDYFTFYEETRILKLPLFNFISKNF